jgi:LAS superfamily LD-carboxypeptidase LdcB
VKDRTLLTAIGAPAVLACLLVMAFSVSACSSNRPSTGDPAAPPSGGSGGLVAATSAGKSIPAAADAPKLPANTAAQRVGNLNVTLAISPYPPVSSQSGTFDIKLTDDKGQPVADASVSLNLTMPAMRMPSNRPNAQALGNGSYRASAYWTMRGQWLIEVIVTRGSEKQSAYFSVWL